ncbi:Fatty acyl-CoA reductase 3 [Bienertia sinuspersici]
MQIPADIFVNTIIVAMKAHVNQPNMMIYHVGSSFRNPISFKEVHEILYHYFTIYPWRNREGNLVKVRKGVILSNIQLFKTILYLWLFCYKWISIMVVEVDLNPRLRLGLGHGGWTGHSVWAWVVVLGGYGFGPCCNGCDGNVGGVVGDGQVCRVSGVRAWCRGVVLVSSDNDGGWCW